MPNIKLKLPDGSIRESESGITGYGFAKSISNSLAKAAIAIKVDNNIVDLNEAIENDGDISIITPNSDDGREILRHSSAHIMAQAVFDLFPGAKYAIGPAIAEGFYYDFELPNDQRFSDDDLVRIEKRMSEIIKDDQKFVRGETSIEEGRNKFKDQPFKIEIIDKVSAASESIEEDSVDFAGGDQISFYENVDKDGNVKYVDMCTGPHVPSTRYIKAFKLMRLAGAYWRGDEKRPMLQRIYGTTWEDKQALEAYLIMLEEAEKRDHRKIGAEQDLFSSPSEIGMGLFLWHPKGAIIRKELEDFSRAEHVKAGYEFAYTPHISKSELFEKSGHLGFYRESMYPGLESEGTSYHLKPMNCPMHNLIFESKLRSYRELPIRIFELGTVYRFEKSGQMHGTARARGFTQDDSHIYCTQEQVVPILNELLDFVLYMLRILGFEKFEADLSTKPEKAIGGQADWDMAEQALKNSLDKSGLTYKIAEGEGAFYGPKIDIHLTDAIGRRWQVSTLQVDFNQPERFELEYVDSNNEKVRPIMIHRALFGSVERMFAMVTEHYAGAFPVWLAPEQVIVAPVADRHEDYAHEVINSLKSQGVRAYIASAESETLGSRIRKAKTDKVPYILVVGDEDINNNTVGVNKRGHDKPERDVELEAFTKGIVENIDSKSIEV
ncbi:MAG: threonine--tRNA ligase [Acidimicrobiia bacterium]|nr:threonine--tRNA ligase [Acidimicrobiia bacterium]